jgi:hypothetical protein
MNLIEISDDMASEISLCAERPCSRDAAVREAQRNSLKKEAEPLF